MKEYEVAVLFRPDLEGAIESAAEKVKKIISDNGGKVVKEENDGKKRLAYPIKGEDFAVYYYFTVEVPTIAPAKISSVLNITEGVMRILFTAVDERKAKYEAKMAAREQKEESKEEA